MKPQQVCVYINGEKEKKLPCSHQQLIILRIDLLVVSATPKLIIIITIIYEMRIQ